MVEMSEFACEPGKQEPAVSGGSGRTSGQLNVAVAVWMVPSLDVASAMIAADPFPKAVATHGEDIGKGGKPDDRIRQIPHVGNVGERSDGQEIPRVLQIADADRARN